MPHPGVEQQSQWLTIRRAKPDYRCLARLGRDEPGGAEDGGESGLSRRHIVGNVWSNSEEDVLPAGDAAKGYTAITTQASGSNYPVIQEIEKVVYDAGKGNLQDKSRIGSVYHNLGVVNGILNVEAVRIAQEKFGHRTLTGDEVRWGFEHLQLDPARVEALGAKGLFHSINVTWDNHEGDGYVTFQRWDGKKWNVVSDWIAPDWKLLRPIIEKLVRDLREGKRSANPHQRHGPGLQLMRSAGRSATPAPSPGWRRPMSEVLLRVENLRAVYNGAVIALTRVDLEVRKGEIVALLGSNGAGKTTTLRAVSNLLPALRGKAAADHARFGDLDLLSQSSGDLAARRPRRRSWRAAASSGR